MLRFVSLSLLVWMVASFPAHAAKRALVIGNNAYSELPDLQKAVADARAYSTIFTELGYEVSTSEDLSTLEMQRAIGSFIDTIEPGDEVAFIYAGHGWSDGSTNYIIGAETDMLTSNATLRRTAIPIENGTNGVVDDLRGQGARIVLTVLDACRNNPFQSKNGRSGSVGLSRGLVLLTAPVSGTFTVFSAGAGEEALDRLDDDDEHPNSVFSRVFLEELRSGGSLQDIVLDTAPKVAKMAEKVGHSQRPAYYDGIGERYCLVQNCTAPEAVAMTQPVPVIAVAKPDVTIKEAVQTPSSEPEVFLADSPLPNRNRSPRRDIAVLASPEIVPVTTPSIFPAQTVEQVQSKSTDVAALSEADPYLRPDPVQPSVPQPAQRLNLQRAGGPVQFIVRSASPIRTLAQLDRESICSVERTPQQPTIEGFFTSRNMSHYNRRFRNLRQAIKALERSRCGAIAVPPRLVADVISAVRDPSRYVVLPEIVR